MFTHLTRFCEHPSLVIKRQSKSKGGSTMRRQGVSSSCADPATGTPKNQLWMSSSIITSVSSEGPRTGWEDLHPELQSYHQTFIMEIGSLPAKHYF